MREHPLCEVQADFAYLSRFGPPKGLNSAAYADALLQKAPVKELLVWLILKYFDTGYSGDDGSLSGWLRQDPRCREIYRRYHGFIFSSDFNL